MVHRFDSHLVVISSALLGTPTPSSFQWRAGAQSAWQTLRAWGYQVQVLRSADLLDPKDMAYPPEVAKVLISNLVDCPGTLVSHLLLDLHDAGRRVPWPVWINIGDPQRNQVLDDTVFLAGSLGHVLRLLAQKRKLYLPRDDLPWSETHVVPMRRRPCWETLY